MKLYKKLEQGTDEWLQLRKGKITGTKLKGVTGGDKAQLTEMYSLLAEKYIDEEELSAWETIQRGHDLEPEARKLYQDITGEKVEEVGFVTSGSKHGLSPDGLIKKGRSYTKAIEIKCPMGKKYIQYLLENKIPDDYKKQVINYFIVIPRLKELDFIIYNPDMTIKYKEIHIINVKREDLIDDIEKTKEKLNGFKKKWIQLERKLKKI